MSVPVILPDCSTCFYGKTERCGGHTTARRQALQQELRGEDDGAGCYGDPGPIIEFLHSRRHPKGVYSSLPKLPVFIPQISTGGLRSIPQYPSELNTFAVSLTTLFYRSGRFRWTDPTELRDGLRLPREARLLVIGSGDDLLLENIWDRMLLDDVWKKMADLNIIASTGFSYSVWDVQSRMDQIINQERNLLTCRHLLAHGIPTIPVVFWYDRFDYQYLAEWLRQQRITTVAVFTRFIGGRQQFERLCEEMHFLQDELQTTLHYVFTSVCDNRRISRLLADFHCSIVTYQPFGVGARGCRVREDLYRERHPDMTQLREELVASNVENYWNFCNQCIGRKSESPIQIPLLNPFSDTGSTAPLLVSTK